MSTALDIWKTHDAEGERRDKQEQELLMAAELAVDAFQRDGFLPGGLDVGDVDAALLEEWPEFLHQFSHSKTRFELLAHAQEVCRRREKIALRLAREGLQKERAEAERSPSH